MLERDILAQGRDAIRNCLDRVPFLKIRNIEVEPPISDRRVDFVVLAETPTGQFNLVVEAKSSGQPRIARDAVAQLESLIQVFPNPYPVFLAPYISDAAARLLEREGVGHIDLAGNCRLSFGQTYIEQRGKENPFTEKRELRSLYSPKAERILRVLLTAEQQPWKVEDLAAEAGVSLGLVSKVKRLLRDREWLDPEAGGIRLRDPEEALAEWAREYRYAKHTRTDYYAFESGSELEAAVIEAARACGQRTALTGFSAAARYAPAVRYRRSMVYCDGDPGCLAEELGVKPVSSGANLTIIQPYDVGVFYGVQERDGLPVVSPIQTYVDLVQQAARGEEAADALFREVIQSRW